MTDVLKVIKETAYLKPKQWVRLKRGIFRDDLAQVRLVSHQLNNDNTDLKDSTVYPVVSHLDDILK